MNSALIARPDRTQQPNPVNPPFHLTSLRSDSLVFLPLKTNTQVKILHFQASPAQPERTRMVRKSILLQHRAVATTRRAIAFRKVSAKLSTSNIKQTAETFSK